MAGAQSAEDLRQALASLPELAYGHARIYDFAHDESLAKHWKVLIQHIGPFIHPDDGLRDTQTKREFWHEADYNLFNLHRQWDMSAAGYKSYSNLWVETMVVQEEQLSYRHRRGKRNDHSTKMRFDIGTWVKFCPVENNRLVGKLTPASPYKMLITQYFANCT